LSIVALIRNRMLDLSEVAAEAMVTDVSAWAIIRNVVVLVPEVACVQLTADHFGNAVTGTADGGGDQPGPLVRIHGHLMFGSLTVRLTRPCGP
jgi:hypothetical protein